MALLMEQSRHLVLQVEGDELHLIHADGDANEVRLVFETITQAEEVLTTLLAASDLGLLAILPSLRLSHNE